MSVFQMTCIRPFSIVATLFLLCTSLVQGQSTLTELLGNTPNTIVPQQRSYRNSTNAIQLHIEHIKVGVEIKDRSATTTITTTVKHLENSGSSTGFQILLPIPKDAELLETPKTGIETSTNTILLNLTDENAVDAFLLGAKVLSSNELLEFADSRFVLIGPLKLSPDTSQDVHISYKQNLTLLGNRIDYRLPRSESFAHNKTPWHIDVSVKTDKPLGAIYSPSHSLNISRTSLTEATLHAEATSISGLSNINSSKRGQILDPGDFHLSLLQGHDIQASFFAYPDPQNQEGCFLMVAGAPISEQTDEENDIKREVILVLDRSGSMKRGKIEQARNAAISVLEGLRDGEAFNIIDYADSVEIFSDKPLIKNNQTLEQGRIYIKGIASAGGTNIHDALVSAVSQEPTPDYLPIIIFLTDGVPTVGIKQEASIREAVLKANVHHRRIFTFGVGLDVNAPLLDGLAKESRASTTFVLPSETVDEKVALLFKKLNGPVFSDIELSVTTPEGEDASHLVYDVLPVKINDLFEGDYLSLLGHYRPERQLVFTLSGNYRGEHRRFRFTFDPERDAIADAPFICRLWASRKIMDNVDQIAQAGAIPVNERTKEDEEKLKEQTEEIVNLSRGNGIITEYTRHLAIATLPSDSTANTSSETIYSLTEEKLKSRAQDTRVGGGASNQVMNTKSKYIKGGKGNKANTYVDDNLRVVEIKTVYQIHDLSFFKRGERWVDSQILDSATTETPDKTIEFGTREYDQFVRTLLTNHRLEVLALTGDILMQHAGSIVLITGAPDLE